MEADTALVRADSAAALHAETPVDVNLAAVVGPGNPEDDDSFGLDYPFEDLLVKELRVFNDIRCYAFNYFAYSLMKFFFAGILGNDFAHESFNIFLCKLVHINNFLKCSTLKLHLQVPRGQGGRCPSAGREG